MSTSFSSRHVITLIVSLGSAAAAQRPIPIRTVDHILASSTENVGKYFTVRATSDGHVFVNAFARQRLYVFDSTLGHFTIVMDSGVAVRATSVQTSGLIPYLGDSMMLADPGARALQLFDAAGKYIRSMAPPRPQDIASLGNASFGHPVLDREGRLIYRTNAPPKPIVQGNQRFTMTPFVADSSPIVRGDFNTRTIDTVGWVRTPSLGRVGTEVKPTLSGGPPAMIMHYEINPFATGDEWAVLSDGTLAIVRVRDYHVDWVDPDGTKRSSPKMSLDWRRFTDVERTARIDSVKQVMGESLRRNVAARPPGSGTATIDLQIVPDSELPTYWPPLEPGSVRADRDEHLWILPTTSTNAANGLTYDVVNRTGDVVERVQLPIGRVLVGFGPNNVLYLARTDGDATYLERAVLARPPRS